MTSRGHITAITLAWVLLFAPGAQGARILFYEVGTPQEYKISGGLSVFASRLSDKGYELASMTRGELSEDRLAEYGLLVIHPGQPLKTNELSAVLWFVLTKGGGVLIIGGEPNNANQIMSPFGMIMDDGILIDSTDSILGMEIENFIVDRFNILSTSRVIIRGISQIGFYDGHGIKLSGNSYSIATGDQDTYSDTLSFTSGSMPPIAAAAIFGNGLVFVLADADMLIDENINSLDNLQFGLNIVEWLGITQLPKSGNLSTSEIEVLIGELKLENLRLDQNLVTLTIQLAVLEGENSALSQQLADTTLELEKITKGKIGPFTRTNIAIIILGLCILGAAMVISKRGKNKKDEDEGEELLSELGYEFEESDELKDDLNIDDIDEDDLDEELGEL